MISYNPNLKKLSRELRNNATDAERCLWSKIRGKQLKDWQFYRQKPIGNYIVDFYCPSAKLIIELDGGQHFSEKGKEKDKKRDSYIKNLGFRVKRYSDIDVLKNIEGVIKDIFSQFKTPVNSPFPKREEPCRCRGISGIIHNSPPFLKGAGGIFKCSELVRKKKRYTAFIINPPQSRFSPLLLF